jgi:hypothetical protein
MGVALAVSFNEDSAIALQSDSSGIMNRLRPSCGSVGQDLRSDANRIAQQSESQSAATARDTVIAIIHQSH